ncbi:hypothetical protein BDR04DRAFT_211422 [Suillus decipiens]|nr:hypothetical protein BDR04DRAFT_211422 [Suillus decipiens]
MIVPCLFASLRGRFLNGLRKETLPNVNRRQLLSGLDLSMSEYLNVQGVLTMDFCPVMLTTMTILLIKNQDGRRLRIHA